VSARVASAAQRLRSRGAKLRARAQDDVLDRLARFFDGWSDPRGAWQRELAPEVAEQAGFSVQNVREGLALGLGHWTGDALRAAFRTEQRAAGRRLSGLPLTAVCLAGAIPMPTLLQLAIPLALRSPVLAKPASRDRATPRAFVRRLREIDPELADCVELVDFRRDDDTARDAFCAAECVVALGADDTIATLRAATPARSHFVGYGHRLSLAVIGPDALDDDTHARALARDVALWDQLGCLSPVAVYALGARPEVARRFGERLCAALAAQQQRAPRGPIPTAAAAQVRHERDLAQLRTANDADGAGACFADPSGAWTVVVEPDARWRPAPLYRFVRVHPLPAADPRRDAPAAAEALARALAPVARFVSSAALAGAGSQAAEATLRAGLARLGASRVCAPGRLQAPPLDWPHDGRPPFSALADPQFLTE